MKPSSSTYNNYHNLPYPNPNPNPNFLFHSHPYPPPPPEQPPPPPAPQITATATSTTTEIPDLTSTLSTLTNLLSLTHQTLTSLSPLFTPTLNNDAYFTPCPHNPNHLMPSESLFHHSLRCPSSLSLSSHDPTSFLPSLHYPKTLNPQNQHKDSNFSQPIGDPTAIDLSFSLDTYFNEFGSNFFYKDCPGVVSVNALGSKSRTFTLPAVLYAQCGDFVGSGEERENVAFDEMGFRVLPSELWSIRKEVEGWVDYPSGYSFSIFCALLRLNLVRGNDLRRWIIVNSPRYGVVIDMYMGDHICLLFRLCLKSIRKEALLLLSYQKEKKTMGFECPVLVKVLKWFVSQLCILYGERNAKCFAIHIFRQCVLEAANGATLFPLDSKLEYCSSNLDVSSNHAIDGKTFESHGKNMDYKPVEGSEITGRGMIFVSQVSAAIAALHERSLLEARLKGLHVHQALLQSERMAGHASLSQRAEEERKMRPDYKAIIEHDGFPRKRATEETSKRPKTREELLAEERDYKRRRMSYRGKKLKRNAVEVTRDIISEYMEEIKLAGGIGCFEKVAAEEATFLKQPSISDDTLNGNEPRKETIDPWKAAQDAPNRYDTRHTNYKNASLQKYEQRGEGHHDHNERLEYHKRSVSQDRHSRDHYFCDSPERHRKHGWSQETSRQRRQRDYAEDTKSNRHEERSSSKSYHRDYTSSRFESDFANNEQKKSAYGSRDARYSFEDRYDPTADSHSTHDDH